MAGRRSAEQCGVTYFTFNRIECSCEWEREISEDDHVVGINARKNFLLDRYIEHRKANGSWPPQT